jgi:hypothetical protein
MTIDSPTTPATFAERLADLNRRVICSDIHEALTGIRGIAAALHPCFGSVPGDEQDALMVGIAPLARLANTELELISAELDALSKEMLKAEVSNA